MLAAIGLLGSDTSALSFAGLSDLLIQMRRIGLDRDADAIALESLQVWKALQPLRGRHSAIGNRNPDCRLPIARCPAAPAQPSTSHKLLPPNHAAHV